MFQLLDTNKYNPKHSQQENIDLVNDEIVIDKNLKNQILKQNHMNR